jgi:recombination protein RecR
MNFSSTLIENGVDAFASLPGIGRKTALRLVLHLLKQDKLVTEQFSEALVKMRQNIRECTECFNLSDEAVCRICADQRRDRTLVCVVENIRDLMAIEDTNQFRGVYHVLGGIISPIEGIGPTDLNIDSLITRCEKGVIKEVVMAISPTIEGETTVFYLAKKLQPIGIQISSIARGVAFGGDLEYADEITLGRSIVARMPYNG